MPASSMRIFYGEASEGLVAENVKIGDPLSLVVSIDEQVRNGEIERTSLKRFCFRIFTGCTSLSVLSGTGWGGASRDLSMGRGKWEHWDHSH